MVVIVHSTSPNVILCYYNRPIPSKIHIEVLQRRSSFIDMYLAQTRRKLFRLNRRHLCLQTFSYIRGDNNYYTNDIIHSHIYVTYTCLIFLFRPKTIRSEIPFYSMYPLRILNSRRNQRTNAKTHGCFETIFCNSK